VGMRSSQPRQSERHAVSRIVGLSDVTITVGQPAEVVL
jgi:hypothetical protein